MRRLCDAVSLDKRRGLSFRRTCGVAECCVLGVRVLKV